MQQVPFSYRFDETDGILRVAGEVVDSEAAALGAAIDIYSRPGSLRVDLSEVTYLTSHGLSAILRSSMAADAAGRTVHLHAEAGSIAQRVLLVTKVPHVESGA